MRGAAQLEGALGALGLAGLGERTCGSVVTDHRSSWVRTLSVCDSTYYIKTYDYPAIADRWRGALRNTGPWTRSRAAREYDALAWMQQHEFPSARPIGALESRELGFVRRAILVTAAFDGASVDEWLPGLATADRTALGAAIGRLVGRLHALGFRDRNLDARNLLARRDVRGAWCVVKIDSPRYVLRRAGAPRDALARADWARLLPQLEPFGIAGIAHDAASRSG